MSKKPDNFKGFPFKKYSYCYFVEYKDYAPILDKYLGKETKNGRPKKMYEISDKDRTDIILDILYLCFDQCEEGFDDKHGCYTFYEDEKGKYWKYKVDGKVCDTDKLNDDLVDHWSDIMADWVSESRM